jgi:hypothetical protein
MLISSGFDRAVSYEREKRIKAAEKKAEHLNDRIVQFLSDLDKCSYFNKTKKEELKATILKNIQP